MNTHIVYLTRYDYVIFKPFPKILSKFLKTPITINNITYVSSLNEARALSFPDAAYYIYKGKYQSKYIWILWVFKYIFNTKFRVHIECELASKSIFFELNRRKKLLRLESSVIKIKKLAHSNKFSEVGIRNLIYSKCTYQEFL